MRSSAAPKASHSETRQILQRQPQHDLQTQRMTVAPNLDYLLIEQVLSGGQPIDELSPEEKIFCRKYKAAFEVGRLAHRMVQGYYAYTAAIEFAKGPHAKVLAYGTPLGQISSYIARKNGTQHTFDLPYYLCQAHTNPEIVDELPRVWLVGSLLAVGDALSNVEYLDHSPLLELTLHLRNGIAHGNKFTFKQGKRTPGLDQLQKFPAHNKRAVVKGEEFQIDGNLEGHIVLFDFMGPGDVLDLLQSVEIYLTRIRERYAAGELGALLR